MCYQALVRAAALLLPKGDPANSKYQLIQLLTVQVQIFGRLLLLTSLQRRGERCAASHNAPRTSTPLRQYAVPVVQWASTL